MVPTGIRPAPNAIVILLKDLLVQCVGCHRDAKAGCYECTPSLTAEEEREAAALLKRAISTSPEQGIIQQKYPLLQLLQSTGVPQEELEGLLHASPVLAGVAIG